MLFVNPWSFYSIRMIIILIETVPRRLGCCILLVWHSVGSICDLYAAESLVRNTASNYLTNYNMISWESCSSWKCWLESELQPNSRYITTEFCCGWHLRVFARQVLSKAIYPWLIVCLSPCWMGSSYSFFIIMMLNCKNCSEQHPN